MAATNVRTIQYSSTGMNATVGQSFSPLDDWPAFEVMHYKRTIDWEAKSSREEFTRRQGNEPPRDSGGTPLQAKTQVAIISGNYAWNLDVEKTVPAPSPNTCLTIASLGPATSSRSLWGGQEKLNGTRKNTCRTRSKSVVTNSDSSFCGFRDRLAAPSAARSEVPVLKVGGRGFEILEG